MHMHIGMDTTCKLKKVVIGFLKPKLRWVICMTPGSHTASDDFQRPPRKLTADVVTGSARFFLPFLWPGPCATPPQKKVVSRRNLKFIFCSGFQTLLRIPWCLLLSVQ